MAACQEGSKQRRRSWRSAPEPVIPAAVRSTHRNPTAEFTKKIENVRFLGPPLKTTTRPHRECPLLRPAHYAASKGVLEKLTRSWAVGLAPEHVRVNAVAPGPTETGALSAAGLSSGMIDQIKQAETESVCRRDEPGEVAAWIV